MTRRVLFIVGCIAVVLAVALPASANNEPTTGTRIGLLRPPATFPANTPFFVEHGFACELGNANCIADQISARSSFELYVDGALQQSTVDVDVVDGSIVRFALSNYPSGLPPGTYTFLGVWKTNGAVVSTATAVITFL